MDTIYISGAVNTARNPEHHLHPELQLPARLSHSQSAGVQCWVAHTHTLHVIMEQLFNLPTRGGAYLALLRGTQHINNASNTGPHSWCCCTLLLWTPTETHAHKSLDNTSSDIYMYIQCTYAHCSSFLVPTHTY